MQAQRLSCASCGATIAVPPDLDHLTCAHCGTALTIERGTGFIASRLAAVVHGDLERVQLRQEATALELQLGRIEAEGRMLRRSQRTPMEREQLAKLEQQYDGLVRRLMQIQSALGVPYTHQFVHPPVPPASVPFSEAERAALRQRRNDLLAEGREMRVEYERLTRQIEQAAPERRTREEKRAYQALRREREQAQRRFREAQQAYHALQPRLRLAGESEI